jgi:alkylation response protein AidB-like acyl-CoA dehydrogenase
VDLDDTPAEAEFRAEARGWLAANAPPRKNRGNEMVPSLASVDLANEHQQVVESLRWQHLKYEAGFGAIAWSSEWGGRGGDFVQQLIFAEEEARYDVETEPLLVTLGIVAPTIAAHGSEDQHRHVRLILAGQETWCQMFSEPGAGSDLAALQTRAIFDGDHWRINGQKVWSSGAHYAEWGYLLARSNVTTNKHEGLTAFVLPMASPGVTVRPLRQMNGGSSFNEVFFDDVVLDDANRLGETDQGWSVAITTLMSERYSVAFTDPTAVHNFQVLVEMARDMSLAARPEVRQQLAAIYAALQIKKFTAYRAMTALQRGGTPGPEGSIAKLAHTRFLQKMADAVTRIEGMSASLDGPSSRFLVATPGNRIGGGTDEMMRNVISERVLGLPRSP